MQLPVVKEASMSTFKEISAVTLLNIKSVLQRKGASSVIVIGVAAVVGVLIVSYAMVSGLTTTLVTTGRSDRAIVLKSGATYEAESSLSKSDTQTIAQAPGIKRGPDGEAIVSTDKVLTLSLPSRRGIQTGITVRGVSGAESLLRPEVELIAGRMFRPGLMELIVGRNAHEEFPDLVLGAKVPMRNGMWTVVGVFGSGGGVHDSEIWTDADTLLSAYEETTYSTVTVRLDSPASFAMASAWLTKNPTLSVTILSEPSYYEKQTQNAEKIIYIVSHAVTLIMAIGAVFGALTTLYSAVRARTVEIATLRAIGFGATGVILSVLTEAMFLSLLGAFLGAAVAWIVFDGNALSIVGGDTIVSAQMVYHLKIGADALLAAIVWACLVGCIGGLPPAMRAARLPVAAALRSV
jgi:putative ABC transport system permease protein